MMRIKRVINLPVSFKIIGICIIICLGSSCQLAQCNTKDVSYVSSHESDTQYIYLTGFPPFLDYEVNPSEIVVHELNNTLLKNYTIIGRILPVNFTSAPEIIKQDVAYFHPSMILCLGLDETCSKLTIELLSINLQFDASVSHPFRSLQKISNNNPLFIKTGLNVKQTMNDLSQENIPYSLSCSAGLYVCNTVFYSTLVFLEEHELTTPMGFIHLPLINNQSNEPTNIDTIIDGIITIMLSHL